MGVLTRRIDHVVVDPSGQAAVTPLPPFLDCDGLREEEREAAARVCSQPWLRELDEVAVAARALADQSATDLASIRAQRSQEAEVLRRAVRRRLTEEISYWDTVAEEERARSGHRRWSPVGRDAGHGDSSAMVDSRGEAVEPVLAVSGMPANSEPSMSLVRSSAHLHAEALNRRRAERLAEIDRQAVVVADPPVVVSAALVIPECALGPVSCPQPGLFARHTEEVDRRAVAAVMAAERLLGRVPREMPHNNPGFDIESRDGEGCVFRIEVKGRITGADTFTVTANEVNFAQSQGDRHRLALVEVSPQGPEQDRVRYVLRAFDHLTTAESTRSVNELWREYWDRGGGPQ